MYQLIGGLMAALAAGLAGAGSLLGGTLVALLTVAWVVMAKPTRRSPPETARQRAAEGGLRAKAAWTRWEHN